MLKKIDLKKLWPYLGAIAFFLVLTIIYFKPVFFDGKDLPQSDTLSAQGMVKDAENYYKETGESTVWSNAQFGGMPITGEYGKGHANIFHKLIVILRLDLPMLHAGMVFTYLIGFFIFLLCLGVNPWLSILGAVTYTFASYNFIIIDVGHVLKGYAMAFMAPIMGGVILAIRQKYLKGTLIVCLFLGLQIASSHVQISYYTLLIILILGFVYLGYAIKDKWMPQFFKAIGALVIAVVIALLPNVALLYPTYDYAKDTMRGGSELSIRPGETEHQETPNAGGLEKDYAFAWSYGKMETFTLLVPNFYGGGHDIIDPNSETANELRQAGANIGYLPTYWGDQPFTAGPVYAGAIVCFLFIFGLFVVKGPEKWWLLAATLLSFMLAWGRHFDFFNDLMFRYAPFYSSFRTPSMALVMSGVTMPFLGILALKEVFSLKVDKEKIKQQLLYSFYITGGLCVLFIICAAGSIFDFASPVADASFANQLANAGFPQHSIDRILDILISHRKSMLMSDAFRSLVFIALAFGTLWFYLKGTLKKESYVVGILVVLMLADLWPVDKRYLNDEHFKPKKQATTVLPTEADQLIMQDQDLNYRVFNASGNTFNESMTSFFHKSVGGYSPTKLRRYQDIIDFYMSRGIEPKVLNMLNTRYFIAPNGQVQRNDAAYGNAWFVNDFKIVDNADEEILAIEDIDPLQTAIIDKRFADRVGNYHNPKDSTATIELIAYTPNHLTYKTKVSMDQMAVFSEVFYEKYWHAYVDGKEVPHFRVDYILRAMIVPAGEHTVEFKAQSDIVDNSYRISWWGSILVGLLMVAAIGWYIRQNNLTKKINK